VHILVFSVVSLNKSHSELRRYCSKSSTGNEAKKWTGRSDDTVISRAVGLT